MPKRERDKGARGERELKVILKDNGLLVNRGFAQFGEPDLKGLEGIHIECKRQERLNLHEAMKQAQRDAEKMQDGEPMVFHRRNHEGWFVTQSLESWIEMYKAWRKEKADVSGRVFESQEEERDRQCDIRETGNSNREIMEYQGEFHDLP